MTAPAAQAGAAGARRRLSAFLYRRRPLKLALLLVAPLSWILSSTWRRSACCS